VGQAEVEGELLVHGNRSVPVVDAIATVDDAGTTWSIALTNRHPSREVKCVVRMKGTPLSGTFDVTVLAGDSPDAFNDVEHPDRVVPVDRQLAFDEGSVNLPAHSLTIIRGVSSVDLERVR
jgi:alpha-N-arabinofuranosidase